MEELETKYLSASGRTLNDCTFLAQRYAQRWGYSDRDGEMWVMRTEPAVPPETGSSTWFHHPTDTQYSGLWRSLAGPVYVTDATHRCVRTNASLEANAPWDSTPLDMSPYGVWGLDDRCVIIWGCRGPQPMAFPMARFDGRTWSPMPDPGFEVYAIHGLSPEMLVAVGADGRISQFDGRAWTPLASPVHQTLLSVWMVSADEIYATGDQSALIERAGARFRHVVNADEHGHFPLLGVAWWQGALWLAGGKLGLLRRVGRTDALETVKPNIMAKGFDARVDLVITTDDVICGSSDGQHWFGAARGALQETYGDRPLHFFRNQ